MPEIEIKRVRFFDGQFLKQQEFRDEQEYHQHMRWRQNYVLYELSGVIEVESGDDLRFFDLDNVAKTFRVRAGMAIARRSDTRDGKEVVLREDHPVIDLDDQGITAGNTAFVTLHYAEVSAADPPSEGDEQQDTRVSEQATITVFSSPPPAVEPTTLEPYILLGTIDFDTMGVDYTNREEARVRASLFGAGPSSTLVSIAVTPNPASVEVGAGSPMTATGTFSDASTSVLSAADGLTWASASTAIATVDATGLVTGVIVGSATITATVGAVSGSATVNVVPALGVPSIDEWPTLADHQKHGTETLTVHGDQFASPMQIAFLAATVGDPDVLVSATVNSLILATVVVPGPFSPTLGDPAVIRTGRIQAITSAGTSADSPEPFLLETV